MELDKPLTTAIIFIVILLLIFFLVFPKYKEFRSVQFSLAEKKAEFNAKYEYYANISDVFRQVEERRADFNKIDDALPDNPNLGKLSYYFEALSQKNGLLLKNLTLSKLADKGEGGPGEITFGLDIFGDYSSLLNFIISLEKSDKLFEVLNISFRSTTDESGLANQSTSANQSSSTSKPSTNKPGSVSGSKIKNNELFDFTLQVKTNFN